MGASLCVNWLMCSNCYATDICWWFSDFCYWCILCWLFFCSYWCSEYGIPLILSCVSAWRVVLPKFSKWGDCCSFWIDCIKKNNMEYVQEVYVLVYMLWYVTLGNVCKFWSNLSVESCYILSCLIFLCFKEVSFMSLIMPYSAFDV